MVSIVIPAHNEEATIGRCLDRLLCVGADASMQIIVSCNGCKDRTADVARKFGDRVTVVETDVASKVHAMNLGDDVAQGFPRFYMDADVVLAPHELVRVAVCWPQPLKWKWIFPTRPGRCAHFIVSGWPCHILVRG